MSPIKYACAALAAFSMLAAFETRAQQSDEELAKALANPIASLISVPLQFNYDEGFGPDDDGERYLTNIQPVVPFSLNERTNLISRTIVPVISQDGVVAGEGNQFGLGDTVQSLFFSPKKPGAGGTIWGVGPVFSIPTATESSLGSEKFGLGPTAVALRQSGPWTYGGLVNHVWSVAGDEDRADVNASFLQPFLNFTTRSATSFFLNTEMTYDWESDHSSIPINAGVNQLFNWGGQRVQIGGGLRYWADAPDNGPEGFGFRVNLVFLFPAGG